ncbi:MAG: hypothetical protein QOD86_1148 [Miltoncostaeaceae bacterium]|jgi:hypothetical protein|nr:hypothetical protein [Miltoncostaeaceae bacterium]
MLRYLGPSEATVWVQADRPCEVEVLGRRERTFRVGSRHFALVPLTGLAPGRTHGYAVALDGERRWPEAAAPAPAIRVPDPGRLRLAFGSCRVVAPARPPYDLRPDDHRRGRGADALAALAARLAGAPRADWPDLLLMLGDQVYTDRDHPMTTAAIRRRRGRGAPRDQPLDLDEHARIYEESWADPVIRRLLASLPSAMIFDDHEVVNDWNTSLAWRRRRERRPWWSSRLAAALMAYWLYQHLGNLSPAALAADPVLAAVRAAGTDGDGEPALRGLAEGWVADPRSVRWSHRRDLGPARLVVLDSRSRRRLGPGARRIADDEEWAWLERAAIGDVDHLLIATSVPVLLPAGLQRLEAVTERLGSGAFGPTAVGAAEMLRRRLGLEHWGAFAVSFDRMAALLEHVGSGGRGRPPASIAILAGDVHHAFLTEVGFRRSAGVRSAVAQVVASPLRNALGPAGRRLIRVGHSRAFAALMAPAARLTGVPAPPIRWRAAGRPVAENNLATLALDGRRAEVLVERALLGPGGPRLTPAVRRRLV